MKGMILPPDVRETLRRAIVREYTSQARFSQFTGISEKHLCKVLAGQAGVSVESAEKIAAAVNMELTMTVRRKPRGV